MIFTIRYASTKQKSNCTKVYTNPGLHSLPDCLHTLPVLDTNVPLLTKKWNEVLVCLDPIHFMASLPFL